MSHLTDSRARDEVPRGPGTPRIAPAPPDTGNQTRRASHNGSVSRPDDPLAARAPATPAALPTLTALATRLRAAGCVFAEDEARLLREAATTATDLERLVAARVGGEPLEHLLGWVELDGVRLVVDRGVFVPRLRTTLLVDLADAAAPPGATVVDLCCGTGALLALLLRRRPDLEGWAADLDPAAVACARRNLDPGRVGEGDLYDALPSGLRGRVDVLVVNAPYVPTAEIARMPPEARDHEHRVALDGGADGLDVHRRVAADAAAWLRPGGVLLIEVAERQVDAAAALLADAGLAAEVVRDPDRDATALRATAPPGERG